MDGAGTRRLRTILPETKTMKKFLLATVALAALGAPALGADLGARPYYNKAPAYAAPLYNWTDSISAVMSAARSAAAIISTASC
jgi:hypothetical protein